MLLSDRTPNLRDFESALDPAVQPIVYSFSSADGPSLVTLLRDQVRQNGSKRFESIAVVNFGPSSTSSHSWPLSAKLAVLDASELDVDSSSEAAHLFRCLGDSVVPGGRVDIFACGLLGTARGIAGLSGIRRSTRTHFAGSANLDANPANPRAQFMMESDGFDIKPLYFKGGGGASDGGKRAANSRMSFAPRVLEKPPYDLDGLCQTLLGSTKCSASSIYANDQGTPSEPWGYATLGGKQLDPTSVDAGAVANLLSMPESQLREMIKSRDMWIGGALYEFMTTTVQPRIGGAGHRAGEETLDVYLRQRDDPTKGMILATCNVCFTLVYYDMAAGQFMGTASTAIRILRSKLSEVGL